MNATPTLIAHSSIVSAEVSKTVLTGGISITASNSKKPMIKERFSFLLDKGLMPKRL